jgi:hypothetical protein
MFQQTRAVLTSVASRDDEIRTVCARGVEARLAAVTPFEDQMLVSCASKILANKTSGVELYMPEHCNLKGIRELQ